MIHKHIIAYFHTGTLVYVLFGTVKEVSIGPTSLMALLTLQVCRGLPLEYVTLLTLLSGVVVSVMGLLQMGECFYYTDHLTAESGCLSPAYCSLKKRCMLTHVVPLLENSSTTAVIVIGQ